MRKNRATALFLLLLGAVLIVCALKLLSKADAVYQEGNEAYEYLRFQVRGTWGAHHDKQPQSIFDIITAAPGSAPAETESAGDPASAPDFGRLHVISRDAVAWLYGPNTVIDYPVMKATDYSYYLNHLPDGTQNANGSLFIDYNCAADFSGRLTVIYGHNMRSGRMFGSLQGYKSQRYYEKNPHLYLYTEHADYRIELLYGCVIGAGQWRERAFMYAENTPALLAYAAENTTFESPVRYGDGDRIVVLSTCSSEFNDARYVVIGVLRAL
ncbi:MAG: class B sortase [Clostridiales bacterium]|nr:class B sortase [Clostridiales bacterium]